MRWRWRRHREGGGAHDEEPPLWGASPWPPVWPPPPDRRTRHATQPAGWHARRGAGGRGRRRAARCRSRLCGAGRRGNGGTTRARRGRERLGLTLGGPSGTLRTRGWDPPQLGSVSDGQRTLRPLRTQAVSVVRRCACAPPCLDLAAAARSPSTRSLRPSGGQTPGLTASS